MTLNICIGVIAAAFVVLTIYLIVVLQRVLQILKTARPLVKNASDLTLDIKEKSESLNFLFHPLARFNKSKSAPSPHNRSEKIASIVNIVTDGLLLYNQFKKRKKK